MPPSQGYFTCCFNYEPCVVVCLYPCNRSVFWECIHSKVGDQDSLLVHASTHHMETLSNTFLVMEYVKSVELFDYIVEKGRLVEDEAHQFF